VATEGVNESLRECRMCGVRPHRLFRNDSMPLVQVGPEERPSHERVWGTEARPTSSSVALNALAKPARRDGYGTATSTGAENELSTPLEFTAVAA